MLVRKNDKSEWHAWNGINEPFQQMVAVCDIYYRDGRIERDRPCEPYPVEVSLSASPALDLWTDAELAAFSLARAVPFTVPEGKVAVGEARYVEKRGKVYEQFDIEDAPPPPPVPSKEERLAALLGESGLTLDDLRQALAQ